MAHATQTGRARRLRPLDAAHVILRVSLPDRPGALGAVASRIGAIGADITDIAVSRNADGSATDSFHLTLPATDVDVMALLVQELREVDGAAIESCEPAECCGTGSGSTRR